MILSDRPRRPSVRMSVSGLIFSIQYAGLHDSYGSTAARRRHSSSTAASGAKPAVRKRELPRRFSNVCFHQKRSSRSSNFGEIEGQLSATSGRLNPVNIFLQTSCGPSGQLASDYT